MNSSYPLGSEEGSARKSLGTEFKQTPTMQEGSEEMGTAMRWKNVGIENILRNTVLATLIPCLNFEQQFPGIFSLKAL